MIAEMRRILPALVVPTALGVLLLGILTLASACGRRGLESPEAVFHRVQDLNERGELRKIWDLFTDDERERQGRAYDEYRSFLATNPLPGNREKCIENFRVTPEALATMSHVEIFVQQVSEPTRRAWLRGAKILDVEPAPDVPNGMRVRWETAQGLRSTMLTQYVDDGWYLITLRE